MGTLREFATEALVRRNERPIFLDGQRQIDTIVRSMIQLYGKTRGLIHQAPRGQQFNIGSLYEMRGHDRLIGGKLRAFYLLPKNIRTFGDQKIGR